MTLLSVLSSPLKSPLKDAAADDFVKILKMVSVCMFI